MQKPDEEKVVSTTSVNGVVEVHEFKVQVAVHKTGVKLEILQLILPVAGTDGALTYALR